MKSKTDTSLEINSKWTFLTNHMHVLLCLHRDDQTTVRDLAQQIGITERSVQRMLSEMVEAKVLSRKKVGRCNKYSIRKSYRLRHPLEKNHTVGELLSILEE